MKATSTTDDGTLCFLAGAMKQANNPSANNFESMSSSVRLQLDAKSKEECVQGGQSYCMARMGQGFVPESLTVSFGSKKQGGTGTMMRFLLDKNCTAKPDRVD